MNAYFCFPRPRFIYLMLLSGLVILLAVLNTQAVAAQEPNDAPLILKNKTLYNGNVGTLPEAQGHFSYFESFFADTTHSLSGTGVRVNSLANEDDYAGYADTSTTLNRTNGYTLRFTAKISQEVHSSNDRAGFSVIAISSDGQHGIELGFWEDEIWAQEGGEAPNLFTKAEIVPFTTTTFIDYSLSISGNAYSLYANTSPILSGTLRDYTAFPGIWFGLFDPYETPNFIFMGDNTTSAAADFSLNTVHLLTETSWPSLSVPAGELLTLPGFGGLDMDHQGGPLVLTMTVQHGLLSLNESVPGGLTAGQITGNNSNTVVVTAPLPLMNTTLAYSPAITYTHNLDFRGVDTATVTLNDQGFTGTGGALSDTDMVTISVLGPNLSVLGNQQVISPGDASPALADGTDFGALMPGDSLSRTFTLQNTGNQALTLTAPPSISLMQGSVFTVTQPTSSTLQAGEAATFTLRFAPQSFGTFSDTLLIDSDIMGKMPYTFTVQGRSTQPNLALNYRVWPSQATPGETITYTLHFSNTGTEPASPISLTQNLPLSLSQVSLISAGVSLSTSATFPAYAWTLAELAPGEAGVITLTAHLSIPLPAGRITSTAFITAATSPPDSDPSNNRASAGLTIRNVAPVLTPTGNQHITETQMLTFSVSASDLNGDALTYGAENLPAGASFSATTRRFTWTPSGIQGPGQYTLTLIVSDTAGLTDSETLSIRVLTLTTVLTPTPTLTPGISLSQTGGDTRVDEAGQTDSYSLVLQSEPQSAVQIRPSADAQLVLTPTQLVFTPGNWFSPQTVTVAAVDDGRIEGNHQSVITHQISTADGAYQSLSISDVLVSLRDNDADSDGDGVLDAQDICPNTTPGLAVDARGCPTVAAIVDASDTPADGGYSENDLVGMGLTHVITANMTAYEEAIAQASPPPETLAELQAIIDQVNAFLATAPIADLRAAYSGPSPWGQTSHFTATVQAGDNISYTWHFGDGFTATGRLASHNYSQPGLYTAVVTASNVRGQGQVSLPVSITLIPTVTLMIQPSVLTLTEATEAEVQLRPSDRPTGVVQIRLRSDALVSLSGFDGVVTNTVVLSFTPGTWNNFQSLRVIAGDDSKFQETRTSLISLTVQSADTRYQALRPAPISVQVLNDDAAPATAQIYLPIITKNYPDWPAGPDLVVTEIRPGINTLSLVISNVGDEASMTPFWVDAYINPLTPPEKLNDTWQLMGGQGAVWGVSQVISPSQSLTLTLNGQFYYADESDVRLPFSAQSVFYAQVDSVSFDASRPHGGVTETHELLGWTYNNISGPVMIRATAPSAYPASPPDTFPPRPDADLPPRP